MPLSNLQRLKDFIHSLVPPGKLILPTNPEITEPEAEAFIRAIDTGICQFMGEKFNIPICGKGPYSLLTFWNKEKKISVNREYITQIAVMALLVLDLGYPKEFLGFEYNHKFQGKLRKHTWPMDIVLFDPQERILLYVETKISEEQCNSLELYLLRNGPPDFDSPDRGNDNLRKAKYLWSTRVEFLWLASPTTLEFPCPYVYRAEYGDRGMILNKIWKVPEYKRIQS